MPDGGFVLVNRAAAALKQQAKVLLPIAGAVALSIRCSTQLIPQNFRVGARTTTGRTGKGRDDDDARASDYNKELGVEYKHNPATGENFLVSPNDERDGPQGRGIYVQRGNDLIKLANGRSDD
jgi:hypothetical protein